MILAQIFVPKSNNMSKPYIYERVNIILPERVQIEETVTILTILSPSTCSSWYIIKILFKNTIYYYLLEWLDHLNRRNFDSVIDSLSNRPIEKNQ